MKQVITDDNPRTSREVRIQEVMLHTRHGQVTLYNIFQEIQIFEDIFSNTLSANISIIDAINIINTFEITGGEKVTISFKSAILTEYTNVEFYIDKISDIVRTNERECIYTLYLVSSEYIASSLKKISRSLTGTVEEMVKDVHTSIEYGLGSKVPLRTEITNNIHKFVIPYWSPLKILSWLCKYAVSSVYSDSGSPFFYFQNKKEFVFSSLENLYNQQIKKRLFYSMRVDQSSSRDVLADFDKVYSYRIKSNIDLTNSISGGAYASRLITYDILTKKYDAFNYDYENTGYYSDSYEPKSERNVPIEKDKKFAGNLIKESYHANMMMKHKHFNNVSYPDGNSFGENSYCETWAIQRKSSITKLNTVCIEVMMPGDSDLNVGEVVEFNLPSIESTGGENRKLDKYFSGRYLVTAIAHYIRQDGYDMKMEICKDSFYQPISSVRDVSE